MNLPKEFEYYISKGIIRKINPDISRARFLIEEAERAKKALANRLKKEEVDDLNANSIIKESYDIIMSLIRARLFREGYSSSGLYAHEAEISYLVNLKFNNEEIIFLNDLRYFRNGIMYYGKILDKEYCIKVLDFLDKLYNKLKK